MFAVYVKPSGRKNVCSNNKEVWVKDDEYEYYVNKQDRGLWETRQEAEKMVTETWETVVEVNLKK